MKAIYIKNYLNLPNEEKEDFLRITPHNDHLVIELNHRKLRIK